MSIATKCKQSRQQNISSEAISHFTPKITVIIQWVNKINELIYIFFLKKEAKKEVTKFWISLKRKQSERLALQQNCNSGEKLPSSPSLFPIRRFPNKADMQIWPQGDGWVTELKSHLLINHVKSLLCFLLDNQRIYMPSVVHYKDSVCLRGKPAGWRRYQRRTERGLGVGRWGRGSREKHRLRICERRRLILYYLIEHQLKVAYDNSLHS